MKLSFALSFIIMSSLVFGQENEFEKLKAAEAAYKKEQQSAENKYAKDTEEALRKLHLEYLKYEIEMEKEILAFEGKNIDPRLAEKAKTLEKKNPLNSSFVKKGDERSVLKELEADEKEIRQKPTVTPKKELNNPEKKVSPVGPNKESEEKVLKIKVDESSKTAEIITENDVANQEILAQEIDANRPIFAPIKRRDYKVSSHFNPSRMHPVLKKPRPHKGIDLAAQKETPIYASANGIVEIAQFSKSAGNWVLLNHQNEYKTKYFHMSRLAVKANDILKAGDLIGYVGSTGYSSGPHLHYEIRNNNVPLDPEPFLISHFE